jgi:hypothetical protein
LRVAFIIGATLLIYLHYTAALFLLAESLFLLAPSIRKSSAVAYSLRQLAVDFVVIAMCCIPAAIHATSIMDHRNAWKSFIPDPSLAGWISQSWPHVYLGWPLAGAIATFVFDRSRFKTTGTSQRIPLELVAVVFVLPLLIAWIATELDVAQLFFRRYLLPTYVAGIVLGALLWSLISSVWLRGAVAVLTVATSLSSSGIAQGYAEVGKTHHDRRQDWRAAVQFINDQPSGHSELALVRSGFLEADQLIRPHTKLLEEYNLAPVNNIYALTIPAKPMPTRLDYWPKNFDVEREHSQPMVLWLVFNGGPASRRQLLSIIRQQGSPDLMRFSVDTQRDFGDVRVLRLTKNATTR